VPRVNVGAPGAPIVLEGMAVPCPYDTLEESESFRIGISLLLLARGGFLFGFAGAAAGKVAL
jgi:hypothetical protein